MWHTRTGPGRPPVILSIFEDSLHHVRALCVHRVSYWDKLWGTRHSVVPWPLDAPILLTLGGKDDGDMHPIII